MLGGREAGAAAAAVAAAEAAVPSDARWSLKSRSSPLSSPPKTAPLAPMAAAVAIALSAHGEGDAHSRAAAALAALSRLCRGGEAARVWRQRCAEAFPWSALFGGCSTPAPPEPSLQARVQELMKPVPAPRAPDLSTLSLAASGGRK